MSDSDERLNVSGELSRIGSSGTESKFTYKRGDQDTKESTTDDVKLPTSPPSNSIKDYDEACAFVLSFLKLNDIVPDVIGHRIVHGGPEFNQPTLVDAGVIEYLKVHHTSYIYILPIQTHLELIHRVSYLSHQSIYLKR